MERIRGVLSAQQEREERRQQADREALARLKQAYAASKAEDTPGGAAAVLKAASGDLKPLDILRIFEAERANLQEAAAVAVADARAAEAQLARAQVSSAAEGRSSGRFACWSVALAGLAPSFHQQCCPARPRLPACLLAGGAACCGSALRSL